MYKRKLYFFATSFAGALDEVSEGVAWLKQGADDYLCKPFDFAELLTRIEYDLLLYFAENRGKVLFRVNH